MSDVIRLSLVALVCTVGVAGVATQVMKLGGHASAQQTMGQQTLGQPMAPQFAANASVPIKLVNHPVSDSPAPYNGETAAQTGWPQAPAQNATPMQVLDPQPADSGDDDVVPAQAVAHPMTQPGYPPTPAQVRPDGQTPDGQTSTVQTSNAMNEVATPAGHVLVAQLDDGDDADDLVDDMAQQLQTYFSAPISFGRWHIDRDNGLSEVLFTSWDHGRLIDGMISATVDSDNGGHAYVMYDDPSTINQTMQPMIDAMHRTEARFASDSDQPDTTY